MTISDDGKGMDAEVLRGKAVEKGIMDTEAAARLDNKDCYNLIFHPGFSTKSEISDISGRGVGMDVVKTRIAQMNGSVEVDSEKGKGSTLIVKLPLTLAILPTLLMDDVMQVEVNGEVITLSGQETVETFSGVINIPIFTTRNISTIANVKDGEAFALGGLLASLEVERVSKVPLLGDIPILGYLFKSKSTDVRKTQIIFYIEPRIVRPEETIYLPE